LTWTPPTSCIAFNSYLRRPRTIPSQQITALQSIVNAENVIHSVPSLFLGCPMTVPDLGLGALPSVGRQTATTLSLLFYYDQMTTRRLGHPSLTLIASPSLAVAPVQAPQPPSFYHFFFSCVFCFCNPQKPEPRPLAIITFVVDIFGSLRILSFILPRTMVLAIT
jgi:hypothetical protein